MSYTKQTWDTNSYVNPTRMNHIEYGIEAAATAAGTDYSNTSSGLSATDTQGAIDEVNAKTRKFDTWEAISSTSSWSASTDGFLYANINPDSSAGGRISFQINGNSYYVNSTSGSQQSLVIPVIKGGTISNLGIFNGTATFKFMPVR